jgi:hypothetical protein
MSNDKFFFIKSFNPVLAETFVNIHVLPLIEKSVENSSRFIKLEHKLRIDHPFDYEGTWESIKLSFTFSGNRWSSDEEQDITVLIFYETPWDGVEGKVIGGHDSTLRALYIKEWTISGFMINEEDLGERGYDDELLREISNFLELAEMNAYRKVEKKFYDDMKSHYDAIENYYAHMHDHITEEPEANNFCERCQESPCACSDPD